MDESQLRPASFPSASEKHWIAALDYVTAPGSESPRNRMRSLSLSPKRQARFPFAIGAESSAISLQRPSVSAFPKFYCTANMKRVILKNWQAKLISLLLATTLWFLIKSNVTTTPSPSDRPHPPPVTGTQLNPPCSRRSASDAHASQIEAATTQAPP